MMIERRSKLRRSSDRNFVVSISMMFVLTLFIGIIVGYCIK